MGGKETERSGQWIRQLGIFMCDVSRKEESRGKESRLVGGRGIEEERMGLGERRDAQGAQGSLCRK